MLSLLHPLDRYSTPSAIGSVSVRPYISRAHAHTQPQGPKDWKALPGYTPAGNFYEIDSNNIILCNWDEIFHENNFQELFPCNPINHEQIPVM